MGREELTSIINDNVKASKLILCELDRFLPVALAGDIGSDCQNVGLWRFPKALRETLFIHISGNNLGTFGNETLCDGSTKSRGGT